MKQKTSSFIEPLPFWQVAVFIVASVGVLWNPTQRLSQGLRSLNQQKRLTPSTLANPEELGPAIGSPPVAEWRAPSSKRSVRFRLLAPAAQIIFLGGTFNKFNASENPLTRGTDGLWETTLDLYQGNYAYKFKVDGEWRLDPTNPERTPPPQEASLIHVK